MSGVQTVIAIYCVVVTCVFIWYVASEREPVKTNKKVGELIEEAVLHDEIPWELVSRDRVRDVRLKNVEAKTTPYLLRQSLLWRHYVAFKTNAPAVLSKRCRSGVSRNNLGWLLFGGCLTTATGGKALDRLGRRWNAWINDINFGSL